MQPEVLLLVIFAVTLWLLGVVSGLLLPIVLQRASHLWHRPESISDDDSATAPGLQSRPLSDVDADEPYEDDLLSHSHGALQPTVLAPGGGAHLTPHWHLGEADLQPFQAAVEPVKGQLLTGDLGWAGWNFIMEKEQPGRMRYASYWRPTANGKTDYLSITILNNTTAQEMHEFNLEDSSRVAWDPMLKQAWLLQAGKDVEHSAEQLVVYLRSFPMGFVTDRLYAGISRREFTDPQQPGCFWTVSKVVHTPATAAWAALNFPGVTLIDDYYSAWECRTILSPWADPASDPVTEPQPACAIILLHHDDLKVPEYLARTAIKLGMYKFVQGMAGYAAKWVQQRRTHTDPFQPDPKAAGRQPAPPLSPDVAAAAAAVAHRHGPTSAPAAAAGRAGSQVTAAAQAISAATAALEAVPLTQETAPAVIRPSRSLTDSPHSSWAGFRGLGDQGPQQQQPPDTPRVLYSVPTAPGPLTSMAGWAPDTGRAGHLAGPAGELVAGRGVLRRGHSLEWEPRAVSSSNSSSGVGDAAEGSGVQLLGGSRSSTEQQHQPGGVWQRAMAGASTAVKLPAGWGRAPAGAVGAAVVQLAHTPAAGWHWLRVLVQGGEHGSQGDAGSSSSSSTPAAAKPGGGPSQRLLAPAGPEEEQVGGVTAAAQQAGGSTSAPPPAAHDFGASSGSGRPAGRRPTGHARLQRLLVGAALAAAVGAGVAAHSRRREGAAVKEVQGLAAEPEGQAQTRQRRRGLLPQLAQ